MKRKMLALLVLLALLCAACGQEQGPALASPGPTAMTAPTPKPTPVPTPQPTPAPTISPETFPYDYSELLADTEDFSLEITALGVDTEGDWVIHLRLENRAKEILNYRFSFQSINGLALDGELVYRVAVGGVSEPCFRILRDEMAGWGFEEPVQWSFQLEVSSAERDAEPFFREELSASFFGQEKAQRYEYVPAPTDSVVMDNEYALVFVTGWEVTEEGLCIDYVAVSRCDRPLLLVLPERAIALDLRPYPAELRDGFGPCTTLMGYIPVAAWDEDTPPGSIALTLALADPTDGDEAILEGTESWSQLNAAD